MNTSSNQLASGANWTPVRIPRILIAILFCLIFLLALAGLPFDIPYVGCGVASAFIFQVVVRPRRAEILGVLAGAAALILFDRFVVHHSTPHSGFQVGACLGFLGLVSFLVLALCAIWAKSDERKQLQSILIPAAGFAFFVLGTSKLLNLASLIFPKTMDVYAYCFDASLGFQPSFVVGKWFQDYALVGMLGRGFYYALPAAMALAYAAYLRVKKNTPLFLLEVFMAAGLLGYFLYLAFPAAGPVYLVGPHFPGSPIPFSTLRSLVSRGMEPRMVLMSQEVCRNAMPSLHMAWALLMAFNCRPFPRWVRALAYFFVFTTFLGTLGTGEHYLIDLVVAFPFSVAVQALCTRSLPLKSPARLVPLVGGSALTVVWFIVLRFGTRVFFAWTPLVPWVCIAATLVPTFLWMRQILAIENGQRQVHCTGKLAHAVGAGVP